MIRTLVLLVVMATCLARPVPTLAQAKMIVLGTELSNEAGSFLKHLLPRFTLKTQIRFTLVPPDDPTAEILLITDDGNGGTDVFMKGPDGAGGTFVLRAQSATDFTRRFTEWLTSDVGLNTIAAYKPEGAQMYFEVGEIVEVIEEIEMEGDAVLGEKLAFQHCGRCHVINDRNKFGGIGSSPSFGALRTLDDWQAKFSAFWTLNPHPSFTQVEGMTEPFDPQRPPIIAPLELTLEDVEAIAAYAATIPPKDLGAQISPR